MADMLRRARDRLSLKETSTSKSNPTGGAPDGAVGARIRQGARRGW